MFFDTPWTRLSDCQKQGRKKGMRNTSGGLTADEYFAIGPVRSLTDKERYDPHNYYGGSIYKPLDWKREDPCTSGQGRFIKVNGKEIF